MVTRINGFSGMDIESLVKSMMATKRVPLDKLNQQKQILEWQRDSYREINSKLYDFRQNKLINNYGMSAALNTHKAVTSGNTNAVSAEATANANGIEMKVSVSQLATYTTIESDGLGYGKKGTTTLAELDGKDLSKMTETEKKEYLEKGFPLSINGVDFKDADGKPLFNGLTSIGTMISIINSNAKANAVASFDEISGKLIIRSKVSGEPSKVEGSTDGKLVFGEDRTLLNLFNVPENREPTVGKNAIVSINGQPIDEQTSNTFIINGVRLTLQEVTETKETVDGEVVVNDNPTIIKTQTDSAKAIETVKSFVEDYNSLLTLLNTKVDETKYRDFQPLTDEQKKALSDDEVKTWTEKAKSGLLKNDDLLKTLVIEMRSIITENLGALSDLGITTGVYTEGGKLILNENKLKTAIEANPQLVMDVFQGPAGAPDTGVFDKLSVKMNNALINISERAGTNRFSADLGATFKEESVMGKRLKNYNSQIESMLRALNNAENRYYKQFAAMETAMANLNAQSSSLLSSLGYTQ